MDEYQQPRGEIKFSLQYHRDALIVMIQHARALPTTANNPEPNTYVKVYLRPDQAKATKRKTKVVRKNCNPSFMETVDWRAKTLKKIVTLHLRSVSARVPTAAGLYPEKDAGGDGVVARLTAGECIPRGLPVGAGRARSAARNQRVVPAELPDEGLSRQEKRERKFFFYFAVNYNLYLYNTRVCCVSCL